MYGQCTYNKIYKIMKKEEINIRITPTLKKDFQDICESDETTMSNKISEFIIKEVKTKKIKTLEDRTLTRQLIRFGVMNGNSRLYQKSELTDIKFDEDGLEYTELDRLNQQPLYGQFGYAEDIDKKLKIDKENSKIIKLIFEMSLNGKGVQAIAEHLNQKEIKTAYALHTNDKTTFTTRHGKIKEKKDVKWVGNTIKTIINNPIYKGQRYWSGKYYPAHAIFEEWYWEKVNENFKNNTNNRGQRIKHNYLLKNLLKCGKCGSNYYGKKRLGINGKNPKENYYMCASKRRGEENCGNKSISIDALDTLIWFHMIFGGRIKELIKLHFSNNDEIIKNQDEIENRIKSLEIEKESLEFQKGKIINAIAIDVITKDEATDKLDNLRKGIQNIENIMRDEIKKRDELNNGIKEKTEIINLFQSLKNLDFEEKKELIKKFIKEIIIVGNEDASCNVSIKFNLFGMKDDVYIISKDRKSAHSYSTNEKKGIDASFIRLNKFKNKLINS